MPILLAVEPTPPLAHLRHKRNAQRKGIFHFVFKDGFDRFDFVLGRFHDQFVVDLQDKARAHALQSLMHV